MISLTGFHKITNECRFAEKCWLFWLQMITKGWFSMYWVTVKNCLETITKDDDDMFCLYVHFLHSGNFHTWKFYMYSTCITVWVCSKWLQYSTYCLQSATLWLFTIMLNPGLFYCHYSRQGKTSRQPQKLKQWMVGLETKIETLYALIFGLLLCLLTSICLLYGWSHSGVTTWFNLVKNK